jgi:hypothetical protein
MPTAPLWQAASQGASGQGSAQQRGRQPGAPPPGAFQQGLPQHGPAQHGAAQHGPAQHGAAPPGLAQHGAAPPGLAQQGADSKGFFGALFDFSFTSFVTTRIIKVLYALILVLAVLSALLFTITMFRVNAVLGLLTLIIGDPLFIIIVMAFWRLVLESFVVVFRIAEDVRALRERGSR